MEIKTELNHTRTHIGWTNRAIILKDKNIIYKAAGDDGYAIYDETKSVIIDGEIYTRKAHSVKQYPCCTFEKKNYNEVIFYRGDFYDMYGFRANTIQEMSTLKECLEEEWKDLKWCPWDRAIIGHVRLVVGHSTEISRMITVSEITMSYKELMNKAKESGMDCERAIRYFSLDISEYLIISVEAYRTGNYDLNTQMLKRLQLKINNKDKKKWYQ